MNNLRQPKRITIDPACWPNSKPPEYPLPVPCQPKRQQPKHQPQTSSTNLTLEALPSFPNSLFQFRAYDGAKALTAIFLLLSTTYLLAGFAGFIIDHTAWLHDLFYHQPLPSTETHSIWWKIWSPVGSTLHHLASYVDLAVRGFLFVCTYCLAWATFDPRNIEGYVMGCFNALMGIVYLIAPIDMIPDFVPVVGGLDDTFMGFGVLLLGLSSIYRNKFRDVKTNTILELIDDGNNQKALTMLLEDKGIALNERK
ncbi:MAG: YkvA family protein [Thermosynechococcaceae cyanobacterium]